MSFDFSALFPGMEVISFQNESKLGKDLEAIFQKVLDYKETIDYSRCGPSDEEKRIYKLNQVRDFAVRNLGNDFTDVLLKDVGLRCKRITLVGSETSGISGNLAICCNISDLNSGFLTSRGKSTGNSVQGVMEDPRMESIRLFRELADCIDLKNSKLTKKYLSNGTEITVSNVYMDVNTLFLMEEFVPESVTEPFTAKEIAAIYLHEIGHAMTTIEHAADMYVTYERVKNFISNVKASSIKEADDLLDTVDKKIMPLLSEKAKELKNTSKVTTTADVVDIISKIHAILEWLRKFTRGSGSVLNFIYNMLSVFLTAFNTIFQLILSIILLTFNYILQLIMLSQSETLAYNLSGKRKISDRINTPNNTFLAERWADEFAIRHGYGKDLAFALDKIRCAFDYSGAVVGTSSLLAKDSLVTDILSIFVWLNTKFDFVGRIFKTKVYEDDYYRARRILQNMKQRFKADKIPNAQCDELLNQLNLVEEKVASTKALENNNLLEMLSNVVDTIVDPITWLYMLKDGKMNRDFAILQDKLDDISSNKLYSLSYKLKGLNL